MMLLKAWFKVPGEQSRAGISANVVFTDTRCSLIIGPRNRKVEVMPSETSAGLTTSSSRREKFLSSAQSS